MNKPEKPSKIKLEWYDGTRIDLHIDDKDFRVVVEGDVRLQTSSGPFFLQFVNTLVIGNLQSRVNLYEGSMSNAYLTREGEQELLRQIEEAKKKAQEAPCNDPGVPDSVGEQSKDTSPAQ